MFSKKMIISLLSVACLSVSNNGYAISEKSKVMLRKAGRTYARYVGHNLGFGLALGAGIGIGAATGKISFEGYVQDYRNHPHSLLQLERATLQERLQVKNLAAKFTERVKQNPTGAIKFFAPALVSLGLALCTKGKVKPVALGAYSGSMYVAVFTNKELQEKIQDCQPMKDLMVEANRDASNLSMIEGQLAAGAEAQAAMKDLKEYLEKEAAQDSSANQDAKKDDEPK